ncbi:hypothetical protein [Stieleria varia]|uniref:Uncharacterized protein n=1 Tax=Stieleria varia TaxID=2528005 RepID=A0A5C6AFD0_9BACT|nr:hypothetical protein [Stieleria varia]TWT98674.1 hypothetical protein Pla52n_51910 [Stieleria varia]
MKALLTLRSRLNKHLFHDAGESVNFRRWFDQDSETRWKKDSSMVTTTYWLGRCGSTMDGVWADRCEFVPVLVGVSDQTFDQHLQQFAGRQSCPLPVSPYRLQAR